MGRLDLAVAKYVGLYRPFAKSLVDERASNNNDISDELYQEYDQTVGDGRNGPPLFSRQLSYLLVQTTDASAKTIVRCENAENGFKI